MTVVRPPSWQSPRIAVALERYYGWHEQFARTLDAERASDAWFSYEVVDLDRHDWIDTLGRFDCVLWKSPVLGPLAASHFKEKIYFAETHLGRLVFPNYKTVWHFESKVAQSYIFQAEDIPSPRTFATFEYHDAVDCIGKVDPPYVFKRSDGASSMNVQFVRTRQSARALLEGIFALQRSKEAIPREARARILSAARFVGTRWMRRRLADRILRNEEFRPAYWQEFVPGNDSDLRISVIGRRHAVAFYRKNRPNDFRASGSGVVDYTRPVPRSALELCFETARKLDVDTMAFDLLERDGRHVITEMSYAYVASRVGEAPGVYERDATGTITFVAGGRMPQELWALGLLQRIREKV